MVILDVIQCSPHCQTTLEFLISLRHWLSAVTMTPFFFCNHGQLELRTIKKKKFENHYIIILPSANMLVHRDKARSLNMLEHTKTTKTN